MQKCVCGFLFSTTVNGFNGASLTGTVVTIVTEESTAAMLHRSNTTIVTEDHCFIV
jgi:hypothetical protein